MGMLSGIIGFTVMILGAIFVFMFIAAWAEAINNSFSCAKNCIDLDELLEHLEKEEE